MRRYRVFEAPRVGKKGLLLIPLRLWTSQMPRIGASETPPSSAAEAAWLTVTAPTTARATRVAMRGLLLRRPGRVALRTAITPFARPPDSGQDWGHNRRTSIPHAIDRFK